MEPTPHDDRPRNARSDDACLSEALDWIVRLNRLRVSDTEVLALEGWCARSAAHARAWREAMVLWRLLLPAACGVGQRPRGRGAARRPLVARGVADIRIPDRGAVAGALSDPSSQHLRFRQSWS